MNKSSRRGSGPELSVYKEITNASFGLVPIGPPPKTATVVIYNLERESMSSQSS